LAAALVAARDMESAVQAYITALQYNPVRFYLNIYTNISFIVHICRICIVCAAIWEIFLRLSVVWKKPRYV